MISIRIDDQNRRTLGEIIDRVKNPRALMLVVGREISNVLKGYFRTRDRTEPNRLGGKRQHFWNAMANATAVSDATDRTVTITIADERFAQKLFGGIIRAFRVANLAIPQTAEAYGRAPSVFQNETGLVLFLIKGTNRLATQAADGGIQVQYILTPSVSQEADPRALPPDLVLLAAAEARARKWADRVAGNQPDET